MRIGNFTLTPVNDGAGRFDGGAMFGVVPKTLWARVMPPDELNRVPVHLDCLLVQTPQANILIDTGLGNKLSPQMIKTTGIERSIGLVDSLHQLGLGREDIDIVVNTHLHSDHAGGNTTLEDGRVVVPTFPRAEYWIQRGEWEAALHPNERTSATYLAENLLPLLERRQVHLLDGDAEVVSGVRCVLTPGHTPWHQSVFIQSQGEEAIVVGDVAPYAVNLERLAWIAAFDLEPMRSLETKRWLAVHAAERQSLLFFEHDPRIKFGRLQRQSQNFRVVPIAFAL